MGRVGQALRVAYAVRRDLSGALQSPYCHQQPAHPGHGGRARRVSKQGLPGQRQAKSDAAARR